MKRASAFLLAMLSLSGVLLFSTTAEAQMRGGLWERGQRSERPDRIRLHERLNLSAEQEQKLMSLRTVHQQQMIDMRAELQKLRLDIRAEMRKDNPDLRAIENLVRRQESLRTEQQLARIKHWNEVRNILTPEQREIWQQYRRGLGDFGDRPGRFHRHHRHRW